MKLSNAGISILDLYINSVNSPKIMPKLVEMRNTMSGTKDDPDGPILVYVLPEPGDPKVNFICIARTGHE